MTRIADPGFDPRIADWLEDDPDRAPSIVLETVVAAFPSIPQRRSWRSRWRTSPMPRFALAAAALALLAIGVVAILARPISGPGNPTAPPSSVPSAPPSSVPSAPATSAASTPSPTPTPLTISPSDVGRTLQGGTYTVSEFATPFSVTLPDGWSAEAFSRNRLELWSSDPGNVNVAMIVLNQVYADPCNTDAGPTALAAGVDNLVGALSDMAGVQIDEVTDTDVGGAPAKTFTFRAPSCSTGSQPVIGRLESPTDCAIPRCLEITMFGGESDIFWVVDAGGTTVLIAVTNTAAILQEAQPVVDSLLFLNAQEVAPTVP